MLPVHELGDRLFEEMCCALWYADLGVRNPDLYGRPRQKQYGVDAIANRADAAGREAMSCKCYKSVRLGQIRNWVDEFLRHWDTYWKERNIRKFILTVAGDLKSHERYQEIEAEGARLAALGVTFEVWAQRQLSVRLHNNPNVRAVYFGRAASALAEPQLAAGHAGVGVALPNAAAVTQLGALQSALQTQISRQLDACQVELNNGHAALVGPQLSAIRADAAQWGSLTTVLQSRVVRMQALIAFDDDPQRALQLLDEADGIAVESEGRVRAFFEFRGSGPEPALAILKAPTSKEGALLRAGLLLEAGRPEEAAVVLDAWAKLKGVDPEWDRLMAFVALQLNDRASGLREIAEAERLAPSSAPVLDAAARMHYSAAMARVRLTRLTASPEPVDSELAGQDDASQLHLSEALQRFDRLRGVVSDARWLERLDVWRMACLACIPGRLAEAEAVCLATIEREPVSPLGRGAWLRGPAEAYD